MAVAFGVGLIINLLFPPNGSVYVGIGLDAQSARDDPRRVNLDCYRSYFR